METFICDVGIPIAIFLIGITQVVLPLLTGDKLFWIIRPGGGRLTDLKFQWALKSAESKQKNKQKDTK